MKKILKRTLVGLLVVLVGIQFIPTDTNQQDGIPETDIRYVYGVPEKVLKVLETSCYDCHSNNTNYPWYSKVQPVRLLMDKHIRERKKELNFSEFGSYSERRKRNKMRAITEQIEKSKMPLPSYLLMHEEAKLSKTDKEILDNFFNDIRKE
ncbi:MAG: heme-binding domain-containing protein [Cytophagales bacterium]|nr:heme-binding domain-containing protein [Cytophagales bacterium]